ncbi:hypothetical protein PUN28_000768 [Cardiocondyla obscurior]|uniref:Uncharacterized protein n=1 Tax=Cardiocondyla obscurior TaxID=286306 RepID=A0AAW2H146_9HYME
MDQKRPVLDVLPSEILQPFLCINERHWRDKESFPSFRIKCFGFKDEKNVHAAKTLKRDLFHVAEKVSQFSKH